jgi:DNA-binding transcriptional regulator GbsR (MarR family)
MATKSGEAEKWMRARDEFITQWGVIGGAWGINRTMAQIHALLMTAPQALTTDEVMDELKISRGNAHMNLRELVGWGLVRGVIRKGERKEYFEAEKDVWKMFCIIARERKRREVEPARAVLKTCAEQTKELKEAEGQAFHRQMKALGEFLGLADNVLSKISQTEQSQVLPWAMKWIK